MLGLEREAVIFLYAMITGGIAQCIYDILYLFRKLVTHSNLLIGVEDILYWVGMSIYIFRAAFLTTYGSLRWFFTLGIVCGVLMERFVRYRMKKVLDKIKKRL